jgi:hypothetical protein
MNKNAIELTMNTIIVAALALLVLVVLAVFFTGGFGDVIGKIKGIISGTDDSSCIVMNNPTVDADSDGYHDSQTYETTCKKNGKTVKIQNCRCDINPNDAAIHIDTGCRAGCDGQK